MACAIEMIDVSKRFGSVVAVDRMTLRLEAGSLVGLLGRNGAGKTTIISLATGLLKPSPGSGPITVLGLDIEAQLMELKRQIGFMPQDAGQLDCLTGPQYIDLVGRLYGLAGDTITRRCAELFETLDLSPQPGLLIREYSFGMRKKLALSAALIHGPRLVFLDEPFEGIDPLTARTVREILRLLQERGTTVLMSSHMLEVVEHLCPTIAIVDQGRLMAFGSPEQIRRANGGSEDLESLFVELMGGARSGELSWI